MDYFMHPFTHVINDRIPKGFKMKFHYSPAPISSFVNLTRYLYFDLIKSLDMQDVS